MFIVTAGECPRVVANMVCNRPSRVETDGTVPCIDSRSGPFLVATGIEWTPLVFDTPMFLNQGLRIQIKRQGDPVPFATLNPREQRR